MGHGVALNGNRMVVSAHGDDGFNNSNTDTGAVYMFSFSDSSFATPVLQGIIGKGYAFSSGGTNGKNINVSNLDNSDVFGIGIGFYGNALAVGAVYGDGFQNAYGDAGEVYLFTFSDSTFSGGQLVGIVGNGYNNVANSPVNLAASDNFGQSVSIDGSRMVIGAASDDGLTNGVSNAGAVYLFTFSNIANFTGAKLAGIIGSGYTGGNNYNLTLDANDAMGYGVSLKGNALAISGYGDDGSGVGSNSNNYGVAYLFTFSDSSFTTPTLQATVGYGYTGGKNIDLSANFGINDQFGYGVALNATSGNQLRLAVGAIGDDGVSNGVGDAGAVYLFSFSDLLFSGGTLQATVGQGYTGGKNVSAGLDGSDLFGIGVSLNGANNTLAVGSLLDDGQSNGTPDSGAVRIFTFADDNFSSGALTATIGVGYNGTKDLNIANVGTGTYFGSSVSLKGTQLAVGAYGDNSSNGEVFLITFSDAAYNGAAVQSRIGSSLFTGKNIAYSRGATTYFGASVALGDNNNVAAGATAADGYANGTTDSGEVAFFTFTDSSFNGGTLVGTIGKNYVKSGALVLATSSGSSTTAVTLEASDNFGSAVSVDSNRIAIGAYRDDGLSNAATNSGAVYLYTFDGTSYNKATFASILGKGYTGGSNLDVSALAANDMFGYSVSLNNNNLAVGAIGDDGSADGFTDSGAVYLFNFANSSFGTPALQATIGRGYSSGKNFSVNNVAANDNFGSGVALSGTQLVVGASGDDDLNNTSTNTGAVYALTFADTSFNTATLQAIIGKGYTGGKNLGITLDNNDNFGASVGLSNNSIAIGATGDDGAANADTDAGSVYIPSATACLVAVV
jgi:hypothetical protein